MNARPSLLLPLLVLFLVLSVALPASAGEAYLVRDIDDGEPRPSGLGCTVFSRLCEYTARGSYPIHPVAFGERAFFTAADPVHGAELWSSDGTEAGTVLLADLCPGSCDALPVVLGVVDGRLLFWARVDSGETHSLWVTDGTAGGTAPFRDLAPHSRLFGSYLDVGIAGAAPVSLPGENYAYPLSQPRPSHLLDPPALNVDGDLFFFADGDDAGGELWVTDGRPEGTRRLADMCPGPCDWTPQQLLPAPGGIYLVGARDPFGANFEVWHSDGRIPGTRRLYDSTATGINPKVPWPYGSASVSYGATVLDGRLWVAQGGGDAGLWRIGLIGAPVRIVAGEEDHVVRDPRAVGDRLLFFRAGNPRASSRRPSLWWIDGSEARRNTRFDHLWTGEDDFPILGDVTVHQGRLYRFVTSLATSRSTLVASTGSDLDLVDTNGMGVGAAGLALRSFGDRLLVREHLFDDDFDVEGDWRLWTVDTERRNGTRPVASFAAVTDYQDERFVVDPDTFLGFEPRFVGAALAGGQLFFAAADAEHGHELWAVPERALDPAAAVQLRGGRYVVSVLWENQHAGGEVGAGVGSMLSTDSAHFWFFRKENAELMVKVLDGHGVNRHDWVFHGGNTDLGYRVTVRDAESGESRVYHRPGGTLCGGADTTAFDHPAANRGAAASPTFLPPPGDGGYCFGDPTALCLGPDGRFEVRLHFVDHHNDDAQGSGNAHPESDVAGYYWFFDRDNYEVMVKVLDGRPVNGRFWVLWGGLTDLAYELEVLDTHTGDARIYRHPAGDLCGGADTTAF